MTVVVGILCNDNNVVIGSDSAMTFGMQEDQFTIQQYQSKKLFVIEESIIVAGAGQVGHKQRFVELATRLWKENAFQNKSVIDTGKILSREAIEDFTYTHTKQGSYGALLAIPVDNKAELIEFDLTDFQPEVKDRTNWYVSMGSGQSIADPLLGFIRKMFWDEGPPNLQGGKLAIQCTETILEQLPGESSRTAEPADDPSDRHQTGKYETFHFDTATWAWVESFFLLNIARDQAVIIQFLVISSLFFCISLILFFNKIKSLYISNRFFQSRRIIVSACTNF